MTRSDDRLERNRCGAAPRTWLASPLVAGLVLLAGAAASADEPYFARSWWSGCGAIGRGACERCCDDYDCKPTPRIPCRATTCGCDDYVRRPIPCTPSPCRFGCDDYDCKSPPGLCWPRTPGLRCVPYCASVSDEPAARASAAPAPRPSVPPPTDGRTTPTASGGGKIRWVR